MVSYRRRSSVLFQADGYAASIQVLTCINNDHVPKLLSHMNWNYSNGKILDYGCGTGSTTLKFLLPKAVKTASKLFCVDISPLMIQYAKKYNPDPNIEHHLASLPSPNFPLGHLTFDAVISINVLHYVQDIREVLSEYVKLLKPGGQIGFNVTTKNSFEYEVFKYLAHSPKWGIYMDELMDLIPVWSDRKNLPADVFYPNLFTENMGLKALHFEFTEQIIEYGREEMLDLLFSMNPCVPKVPMELMADLREEYNRLFETIMRIPRHAKNTYFFIEYMTVVLEKIIPD